MLSIDLRNDIFFKKIFQSKIKDEEEKEKKFSECKTCKKELVSTETNILICKNCGLTKEIIVVGDTYENKEGYKLRSSSLIKTPKTIFENDVKTVSTIAAQNPNNSIPQEIIEFVAKKFGEIKQSSNTICRGNSLTSLVWALISIECANRNVAINLNKSQIGLTKMSKQ